MPLLIRGLEVLGSLIGAMIHAGHLTPPAGVLCFVGDLKSPQLPQAEFDVLFASREVLYRVHPEMRAEGRTIGIFLCDVSSLTLLFFYGSKLAWTQGAVLHEFAHVLTHFTHGDEVEPHGDEFVGALCHLPAEVSGLRERAVLATALG